MKLLFFLLFMLIEFAISSKESDAVKQLNSAIEELSNEIEKEEEIFRKLTDYGKKVGTLFKVFSTVGTLLTTAYDVLVQPDSPELEAIKELNENMDRKFQEMKNEITNLLNKVQCQLLLNEYQNEVKEKIRLVKNAFLAMVNVDNFKKIEKLRIDFIAACKTQDLEKILTYINFKVHENCIKSMTYERVWQHSTKHSGLQPQPSPMNVDLCHGKEKTIDNPDSDEGFPCFLKVVYDGNQHKRGPLLSFISVVYTDLIELQFLSGIFLTMVDEMDVKGMLFEDMFSNSLNTMRKWSHKKLTEDWDDLLVEEVINKDTTIREDLVKEAIKKQDTSVLDGIANKIATSSRQRGMPGFNYQAHVWSDYIFHGFAWPNIEIKKYAAVCSYFCKWTKHKGLDIMLYRYEDNEATSYFVDTLALEWVTSNEERIRGALMNVDPKQMNQSLERIQEQFTAIEKFFGGVILTYHLSVDVPLSEAISSNEPTANCKVQHTSFTVEYRSEKPVFNVQNPTDVRIKIRFLIGDKYLYHRRKVFVPTNITIVATPKLRNTREFIVNFLCDDGEILLHFNPRFNTHNGHKVVVMNSFGPIPLVLPLQLMEWGEEERIISEFPFESGQKFTLNLAARPYSQQNGSMAVEITVNGHFLHEFVYRKLQTLPVDLGFDTLEIYGDIEIESVDVKQ